MIKVQIETMIGGNWTVIICPADQKTFNIHYTPALVSNSGYHYYDFTFEFMERRYLIFKASS